MTDSELLLWFAKNNGSFKFENGYIILKVEDYYSIIHIDDNFKGNIINEYFGSVILSIKNKMELK